MKKTELIKIIKEETQNVINEDVKSLQSIEDNLDNAHRQANKLESGTPLYTAITEIEAAVRSMLYHIARGAK